MTATEPHSFIRHQSQTPTSGQAIIPPGEHSAWSEEYFRALIENALDITVILDSDATIRYATPSVERALGYTLEEVIGKSVFEFVHPDDGPDVTSVWVDAVQRPGVGRSVEFRVRHKNGSWHILEAASNNLLHAPVVAGVVLNCRDVTERKRAEEALRESEERYRRLVELSPDAIIVHSEGKLVFANNAAARLVGASSPTELVGKPVLDFAHPGYRDIVRERVRRMREEGKSAPLIEEKFLRLDGTIIDVETTATLFTYQGKPAIQVVAHDITARKQAEEALRESEERYRTLAEVAHDMIFIISADGYVQYVNSFAANQFGCQPEDIIGKPHEKLFPPDVSDRQKRNLRRVFEIGVPLYAEDKTTFPERQLWLGTWLAPIKNEAGEVDAVLGIARDITERKLAEEERERLLAAEHSHRLLAETLREVTTALNTSLNRTKVLRLILEQLARVVNYDSASVMLMSDGKLDIVAQRGFHSESQLVTSLRVEDLPHAQQVLERRVPVIISDTAADSRWQRWPHAEYIRCWLGVPLVVQDRVIGLLNLDKEQPGFYTQREAEVVVAFANQAAVAVENARLFEAAQQHVAELEAVRQASLGLTSSLELPAVLQAILASALKLSTGVQDAHVFLYQAGRLTFGTASRGGGHEGLPVAEPRPQGLTYTVARQGEPVVVPDMRAHPLFADAPADWGGAIIGLPLKIGQRVVGVMNVTYRQPRVFPEAELRMLRLLADQAAIAIENARLYQEVHHHAGELGALIEIGRDISATLDLPTVLKRIATHARDLLEADDSEVYLLEPDGQTLRAIVALGDYADEIKSAALRLGEGIVGSIAQSGIAEVINNVVQDPRTIHVPGTPEEDHALMCAPLISKGKVIGVMALTRLIEQGLFSQGDLYYLTGLARQASIAIENARLYQEVRLRAGKLSALIEIGRDVLGTLDLPVVLERIATHARDLLAADDSEVYLLEPDGQTLRAIIALGQYADEVKVAPRRLGEGIVGSIAQSGIAEVINSVEQDPRGVHIPDTPEEDHALMCAPLISKGKVIGVMALTRYIEQGPFDQADLDFLAGLARQAAIAIENARLYASEQQRTAEFAHALEQQKELDHLKNQFIQNVSHELRTPLAIVRGYAELLETGELGELKPEQQEPISIIARRTRMLGQLVGELTAILQVETRQLEREPVDLAQLVHTQLADFRVVAEKAGLTLLVQVAPDLSPVSGDPTQLRRVLDNLLGNALKFTPPGGTLTVRLWQDGTNLALEVADTGVGIPPDKIGRIFERFYQVDGSMTRRYGGVGLGLALVKEIIEAHGGQVSVTSTPGQGSTFRVTLPVLL